MKNGNHAAEDTALGRILSFGRALRRDLSQNLMEYQALQRVSADTQFLIRRTNSQGEIQIGPIARACTQALSSSFSLSAQIMQEGPTRSIDVTSEPPF